MTALQSVSSIGHWSLVIGICFVHFRGVFAKPFANNAGWPGQPREAWNSLQQTTFESPAGKVRKGTGHLSASDPRQTKFHLVGMRAGDRHRRRIRTRRDISQMPASGGPRERKRACQWWVGYTAGGRNPSGLTVVMYCQRCRGASFRGLARSQADRHWRRVDSPRSLISARFSVLLGFAGDGILKGHTSKGVPTCTR